MGSMRWPTAPVTCGAWREARSPSSSGILIAVVHRRRWLWLATILALGCAGGAKTDDTTTFGPAPGSGPPSDDGATTMSGDDEGATFGVPDGSGEDAPLTTGPSDEGTTGPGDDGSTTDGGESSGGDDGPMGNCSDPGTCQSAGSLGSVSGDQGSPGLDGSGAQPDWLTFRVTEDDDSIDGAGMSFTVTLTSPPGADFDLYVYRGVEGGGTGCGGFMQSSTNGGGIDEVTMNWGEGLLANGVDDSAWVAVEVVAKNDMCAPPAQWMLTVDGNT